MKKTIGLLQICHLLKKYLKAIATQIHSHLINRYHNRETALLRVYNDIVTTIGRGNGTMCVLLDLPAALIQLIMIFFFVSLRNMWKCSKDNLYILDIYLYFYV